MEKRLLAGEHILSGLRCAVNLAKNDLSIARTAADLGISAADVGRRLTRLEQRLGTRIFARRGVRLAVITSAGVSIISEAAEIINRLDRIPEVAIEAVDDHQTVVVGATHMQANYFLADRSWMLSKFMETNPKISVIVRQAQAPELSALLAAGLADLVIATDFPLVEGEMVALPCYQWERVIVSNKPIASEVPLDFLAAEKLITYAHGVSDRWRIDKAFGDLGIEPNVVATAQDSGTIVSLVRSGLGVGIVSGIAANLWTPHSGSLYINIAHRLFQRSTANIILPCKFDVKAGVFGFIAHIAPHLSRELITEAVSLNRYGDRLMATAKRMEALLGKLKIPLLGT